IGRQRRGRGALFAVDGDDSDDAVEVAGGRVVSETDAIKAVRRAEKDEALIAVEGQRLDVVGLRRIGAEKMVLRVEDRQRRMDRRGIAAVAHRPHRVPWARREVRERLLRADVVAASRLRGFGGEERPWTGGGVRA